MSAEWDAIVRIFDEAAEQAKQIRIDLDAQYLRAIALVEALPENQPRTDKTWVRNLLESSRLHFSRVVLKR